MQTKNPHIAQDWCLRKLLRVQLGCATVWSQSVARQKCVCPRTGSASSLSRFKGASVRKPSPLPGEGAKPRVGGVGHLDLAHINLATP